MNMKRIKPNAGVVLAMLAVGFILLSGGCRHQVGASAKEASADLSADKQDKVAGSADRHPSQGTPRNDTEGQSAPEDEGKRSADVPWTSTPAQESIESGFVFIDGKYIEAPYSVVRHGPDVYINGSLVEHQLGLLAPEPVPQSDPAMPPEITKDSSMYDKSVNEYIRKKVLYVQAHHTPDEERRIMEGVYRSLPYVKQAEIDPKTGSLHIVTFDGLSDSLTLVASRRKPITGVKAIEKCAEGTRLYFEDGLTKGRCYFLSSRGGRMVLGTTQALPEIVKILRSKAPVDEKFAQLHRLGIRVDQDFMPGLVTGFSASEQLEQRLEGLERTHQ